MTLLLWPVLTRGSGPVPGAGQLRFTKRAGSLPTGVSATSTAPTSAPKASAPKASATSVPKSTAAPLLSGPGLVDCYGATVELLTIERGDCSFSFRIVLHFHKGEPFGAARIAITDHMDLADLAMSFERVA